VLGLWLGYLCILFMYLEAFCTFLIYTTLLIQKKKRLVVLGFEKIANC
jgi:hypothetical protein